MNQAGPDPGRSSDRVSVPLLTGLFDAEDAGRRRIWADLGRAQSGLINRLTLGRNCLIVADLPTALAADITHWYVPDAVLEARFWTSSVDCFLCWDLLNYMQHDQLAIFSSFVARHSSHESRLHALIQYSGTTMSESPGSYMLETDGRLRVDSEDAPTVKTPRYSPKALEKAMPELRVERTMLLNNGMQEFVFGIR